MRRSKTLFSLFIALASLFMLGGCVTQKSWEDNGQSAPAGAAPAATLPQASMMTPPADLPPVKVALLVPLTGRQAALGQALLNAAQMALFDVGYNNFELLPGDTGGTTAGAAKAAASAVQGGAQLILGPVFSDEVRAAKPALGGTSVNMIAFSTDWELADNHTFVMGFLPFDQVERITNYAAAHNLKRIAVIAPSSDYGRTVIPAYQTMASRNGIQTPQSITLQTNNPQASAPALQQLAQAVNYDAVFMPLGGESAAWVSGTLAQDGMPAQIRRLGTGLFDDDALAMRPELAGAWFAAPAPALRENFERRYLQTYNAPAPRIATLSYDATALAATLAQRRTADMPAFGRDAILNPNGFAGLDGIFRFRPNGLAERGLAVLEYRGGQVAVIDPAPTTFQTAPAQTQ